MTYLMMREPGDGTLLFPPKIEILDLNTRFGKLRGKYLSSRGYEIVGRITTDLDLDELRGGISRPALDNAEELKDQLLKIEMYIGRTLQEMEG